MKKKLTTIVTALVLCLMMGTTALAAPSSSYFPSRATTLIDGKEVVLKMDYEMNDAEGKARLAFFKPWWDAMNDLEDQYDEGKLTDEEYDKKYEEEFSKWLKASLEKYLNVTCDKVNWYKNLFISLPDGVEMPAGGIDITIADSDISAKDEIILMHIKSDGTFEKIDVTVKDGSITGHFNSLSPVVYFSVSGAKTVSQPASAPKTGEQDLTAVVLFAGAAMLGTLVYFNRKRNAV